MGLDMYLKRYEYISTLDYDDDTKAHKRVKKFKVNIKKELDDGTTKDIEYEVDTPTSGIELEIPVAYWRKANAIHRWFLENTGQEEDKCQKIYIGGNQLQELVKLCEEVLADHSKAEELLPTQEGFFFGPTEYGDWYFEDLANTVKQLKDLNPALNYVYQASW